MPSAPAAIFTPPGTPTPGAPGAVHAPPSASPAAIGAVHVPPVAGGSGVSVIKQTGSDPIPMTEGTLEGGRPTYAGPDSETLGMVLVSIGFGIYDYQWRFYSPGTDPEGSPSTAISMGAATGNIPLAAASGWVSLVTGLPITGFQIISEGTLAAPGAVHASPGIPSPSSPGAVHASPGIPSPTAPPAIFTP